MSAGRRQTTTSAKHTTLNSIFLHVVTVPHLNLASKEGFVRSAHVNTEAEGVVKSGTVPCKLKQILEFFVRI